METAPKDAHTLQENLGTQPLTRRKVFANPTVVAEGWYPVCPASELGRGEAKTVVVTRQRVCVYRDEQGGVHALDAFCPHMGASLANGRVVGDRIECYFHRWQYDPSGRCVQNGCASIPSQARVAAWPAEQAYGFVWVYAGREAPYPVPRPPGLEDGEVAVKHLGRVTLFAHHHAMMAGGIDLLHFSAVHGLDVAFQAEVLEHEPTLADWRVRGKLGTTGWRSQLARWLLGDEVGYDARFAGGSLVTLAYGPGARFRGTGFALPTLYILWGCTARPDGIGEVDVFLLAPKRPGLFGGVWARLRLLLTLVLLGVLRDDDVKAFPHMRFDPRALVPEDASVARLVAFLERQPVSPWTGGDDDAPA